MVLAKLNERRNKAGTDKEESVSVYERLIDVIDVRYTLMYYLGNLGNVITIIYSLDLKCVIF